MNDLKKLLSQPFKDREWLVKMLLGSVITIVPVFNFLSLGYFLRCIKHSWRGHHALPAWDNWPDLFKEGCLALLITLLYLAIPLALGYLVALIPIAGIALASIIIFIMGLIIPMAIASFAICGSLRDAFYFKVIIYLVSQVFNLYVVGYLAATLSVILGLSLLLIFPLVGFVGGAVIFYCGVVFANFLGTLYREA